MMPMGQGLPVGEEPELMMDINTTPLIDVLLVLLVMLIITIPIQLHAIDTRIPATAPTAAAPPSAAGPIEIAIDAADRVTWQGVAGDARCAGEPHGGAGAAGRPGRGAAAAGPATAAMRCLPTCWPNPGARA